VAGRTGAIATARMFEMNVITEQDIENRAWQAVVIERCIRRAEFDNSLGVAIFKNHANLGHLSSSGSVFTAHCEGVFKALADSPDFRHDDSGRQRGSAGG
jgi:hypothetical protein